MSIEFDNKGQTGEGHEANRSFLRPHYVGEMYAKTAKVLVACILGITTKSQETDQGPLRLPNRSPSEGETVDETFDLSFRLPCPVDDSEPVDLYLLDIIEFSIYAKLGRVNLSSNTTFKITVPYRCRRQDNCAVYGISDRGMCEVESNRFRTEGSKKLPSKQPVENFLAQDNLPSSEGSASDENDEISDDDDEDGSPLENLLPAFGSGAIGYRVLQGQLLGITSLIFLLLGLH